MAKKLARRWAGLKIAFLNLSFGKVNRGVETFELEVSKRLRKMGHEVEIMTSRKNYLPRWPLLWRVFLDPQGIQVMLFTLKNIPRILRKRYDVIIPVDGGWQPALVRLITWLYRGKMIISGQSGKGWDDRNNLWCFPNAFVAISSFAERWAKKVNPFVKSVYIPNGVDCDKFNPHGEKIRLNMKTPIVLSVGAFTKEKRLDCVIKAVAEMGNCSLLIAGGGGNMYQELEKLGRKLLRERFMIKSYPFEQMPKVYRIANLFTLPSSASHSFEIVLVEAMATGLGVVANDDPIRREIVGEGGLLVNPEDIAGYARTLEKALELNWGDKPRKQAKKFDWDEIAKRYEVLFLELCQK